MSESSIELKPLTVDLAPMIRKCLRTFPKRSCDLNLCNLFTWGSLYHLHYFIWNEAIVIYNPRYHYIAFPFCYEFDPLQLAKLVYDFRSIDKKTEMILFPSDWVDHHPEACKYFRFHVHEQWSDYIYLSERLFTLSGKKLAKKKNLLSQFRRNYPFYRTELIVQSDKEAILEHFKQWQSDRNIKNWTITLEYRAVVKAFEYWNKLPFQGIKIMIDNNIIAWTIFSEQTTDMITVHFEKFDPNIKGSAQVINWETAKYVKDKYKYINREQDMGIEGLRHAKRSYDPIFMEPFLTSKLKSNISF